MDFRFILPFFIVCSILNGVHFVIASRLSPPEISEHPLDVVVKKHEPVTLNCKAEGKPSPTIEWYKDGEKVRNTQNRMILNGGSLFFLHVIQNKDTGTYWCVARNEIGKVKSRNASLAIAVFREEFKVTPKSTAVNSGETVTLECSPPRGHPEPTVSWKKDGKPISLASGRVRVVGTGNLRLSDVKSSDKGRYVCVAENTVGIREAPPVTLNVVVKPFFMEAPRDVTALAEESVEFTCKVGGDPVPSITWYKKDGRIPFGRAQIKDDKTLRIKQVSIADEGIYTCEAENQGGIVISSATLTVHSLPAVHNPLFISTENIKVPLNSDTKLDCIATGNPYPSLFWRKEGTHLLMFPGKSYGRLTVTTEGALVISRVEKGDQSFYYCSAVSNIGSSTGKVYLNVVTMSSSPPPIIQLGPSDQILAEESVLLLPCEVSPVPPASVTWLFKDKPLPLQQPRYVILDSGTLQIDGAKQTDSGLYTCVARHENGETKWTASVSVKSPLDRRIVFHKVPDRLKYPSPPSKPIVVNISESSVTLLWRNEENSENLIGYTIEYYSSESHQWTVGARRVTSEKYTIPNLKKQTSYIFLVRAENDKGLGYPSPLSDEVFTSKSSDFLSEPEMHEARHSLNLCAITLKDVRSINATSVKLLWDLRGSRLFIEGFNIRFRDITTSGHHQSYDLITVRKNTLSSFLVHGLKPYTNYEFFLVPFYKIVQGPPSNTRSILTMESVPTASPDNLFVKVMNDSFVDISWSPLPNSQVNGILKGYTVKLATENPTTEETELNLTTTTTQVTVGNLRTGIQYQVTVAAFTSVGPGPLTPPVPLKMDPGYSYSFNAQSGSFPNMLKDSALQNITKEPVFIFGAVAFMFVFSSIILVIVARKHVGWKKAVGAHISVELSKWEEIEKCGLNGNVATTAKWSWLGESSKALSGPEATESYSDESNHLTRRHHQLSCNRQIIHDYDTNNEEEAYYAEVGNPSMVTFGKKPEMNLTEAYATTTLINTYQTHRSHDSSNSTSSDPSKQLLMPNTCEQYADNPFTKLLNHDNNGSCKSVGGVLTHVKVCDAPLMQRRFQSLRQAPYETKLDNNQRYL